MLRSPLWDEGYQQDRDAPDDIPGGFHVPSSCCECLSDLHNEVAPGQSASPQLAGKCPIGQVFIMLQ